MSKAEKEKIKELQTKLAETQQPNVTPKTGDMLTIQKSVLDKILQTQELQNEELITLRKAADKSRLALIEGQSNKKIPLVVKLSTFETNGKQQIIVGWKMVIDEVFQDTNGIWHEKQIVNLKFNDGTSIDAQYIDFTRRNKKIEATILSRSTDEATGHETLKVELSGGETLNIDSTFVN